MKYIFNYVATVGTEDNGEDSTETVETGIYQQRRVVPLLETVIGM